MKNQISLIKYIHVNCSSKETEGSYVMHAGKKSNYYMYMYMVLLGFLLTIL